MTVTQLTDFTLSDADLAADGDKTALLLIGRHASDEAQSPAAEPEANAPEPEPQPEPETLPPPPPAPRETLTGARILEDRLDVAWAYGAARRSHPAQAGDSPEAFAKLWFDRHGRFEGYAPEASAGEGAGAPVSLAKILDDRPDVLKAFYAEYYDGGAFARPDEWTSRVGGTTAEDYARFWYDRYGKWEGYSQPGAGEQLSAWKLMFDRPDVVAEYHAARDGLDPYYVKDWVRQVGGDGVEAYARHWYNTHGKW